MPTLADRIRKKETPRQESERLVAKIWEDKIALAASKRLLKDAYAALAQEPGAPPVLTVMERIKTFLERHP